MPSFFRMRPRVSGTSGAKSRWLAQPQGMPVDPTTIETPSPYNFHQADVFYPGAANWVFEPTVEDPVVGPWGAGGGNQGVFRQANTFRLFQPPQVWINQTWLTTGLGGLQAGQLYGQPLLDTQSSQGGGT